MPDFTSEDDIKTFEGWLKYQGIDESTLTLDELEMWRSTFDECSPSSSVGLMKLKPLAPGEYRYAVAVRDGSDLWLTSWIRRAPTGDVYVLIPRSDGGWDPHASYHRDGRTHSKSFGKTFSRVRKLQPLDDAFHGTEHLGMFAGHAPKTVGAICDPAAFSCVVEVPPDVLGPRDGAVVVDLIQPGCEPMTLPLGHIIRQDFNDAFPSLVIRICDTAPADTG